jgi:sulfopropanediol 3-dehydrogenase
VRAPDQYRLPGTDPIALPQPRPTPQVGNALTGGPHEAPWADHPGTLILDGLVTARTSATNGFCSPEPHVLGVVGGAWPDPLPGHPGDPSLGGFVGAGGVGSITDAWTTGFTDLGAGNEHGRPRVRGWAGAGGAWREARRDDVRRRHHDRRGRTARHAAAAWRTRPGRDARRGRRRHSDGGAGHARYTGGGGQDQFISRYGEANEDKIVDFDGVGAAAGDIIRLPGFAPGTRVVEPPYDTWSSHGVHVWPHGSGYELGDFTAPKGLVVGQDIVFGRAARGCRFDRLRGAFLTSGRHTQKQSREPSAMRRWLKQATPKAPADRTRVRDTVQNVLAEIERDGDEAVHKYARQFDKWDKPEFRESPDRIMAVTRALPETFKDDFAYALKQVTEFAKVQRATLQETEVELEPGVTLGQKLIPISKVGCYIPGGKYPLVSAAIMSVATARAAGCEHVIGAAPPRDSDGIYAPTLYALHASGAHEVFCIGGIQALASMAYGRVGMSARDFITGPGNAFVAEAKRQLFGTVGIDLMAGPTEIAVIADDSADPALVATDLLGQAEHGPDSPAWLFTTSEALGRAVLAEIELQLPTLPTRAVAEIAWRDHGEIIVVDGFEECVAVSDAYAPEHLEVQTREDDRYMAALRNYGSLFVGEQSTVAYGDKGIGTNHTLPTGRAARYTGGLWVGKFIKTVTWQRLTDEASRRVAPALGRLCHIEGMLAHEKTADVRFARYAPKNSG